MDHSSSVLKTPAAACRLAIFQPTRKPTLVTEMVIKGQWGKATLTGAVGQRHRDVLDTVIALAEGWRPTSEGDIVILIDSAQLRAKLGWDKWSYPQIHDALQDLIATRLSTALAGWPPDCAGIVMRVSESLTMPPPARSQSRYKREGAWEPPSDPTKPRGGMSWEVTISRGWLGLMRHLSTRYHDCVLQMRYGVSQAVTRFMLSHKAGARYEIDTALDAVGVKADAWHRTRARRQMSGDRELMAKAGVFLDGNFATQKPGTATQKPGETHKTPEPIDL